MKVFLILGCQRSGTTLLTTMLGAHKDINMLDESITRDIFKMVGKEYRGNKLVIPRQIKMRERASRFGYLVNRIFKKFRNRNPYPISRMSLQDYLNNDAKIIIITRDKEATISSMMKRSNYTRAYAEKEFAGAENLIQKLVKMDIDVHQVTFEDLLQNTEDVIQSICDFLGIDYDPDTLVGFKYNYRYHRDKIEVEKAER